MNTDVENLLREGMERFTANLRAPAGLTRWVARRRRRRLALRSGAAVAAALTASIVALAVAGVPGAGHGADTTAYVVKRVNSALSAAEPGEIAQMTVTTRLTPAPGASTVTSTAEEWSYGDRWRSVTHSPTGQLVYDEGATASLLTVVSYPERAWSRQPLPASLVKPVPETTDCEGAAAAGPLLLLSGLQGIHITASSLPTTVGRALHTAISCGTLKVAGRQRVNGVEVIELTSSPSSLISETIWVSPGTYLPVRVVVRSTPTPGQTGLQQTANIAWLSPTTQNLAKLTVPVPAKFRPVPLNQALAPFGPQSPDAPKQAPKTICLGSDGPTCKA